jgi:hypothetical protein
MGGSGSQRELLLHVAGDDPSTVLARRGAGEIRSFSTESAREEQWSRAQ